MYSTFIVKWCGYQARITFGCLSKNKKRQIKREMARYLGIPCFHAEFTYERVDL